MNKQISPAYYALLIFCALPFVARAEEVHVTGRISKVTLFPQQAEVTRAASASIRAGRHSVIFDEVPQHLNADSLKVSGSGSDGIMIEGVEYKSVYLSEEFSKEAAQLDERIATLSADAAQTLRSKERIEAQRKGLQELQLDRNLSDGSDKVLRPRSAKEMAEVLSFVAEGLTRLDAELRQVEEKSELINRQLTALQQERSKYQPSRKAKSVVEVKLSAPRDSNLNLEVTYQTGSSGWNPSYNLMVSGSKSEMSFELQTYALISQKSGEDWLDVELNLSTARPQLGLSRPLPRAKIVDVYEPPAVQSLARGAGKAMPLAMRPQMMNATEADMMEDAAPAPAPVQEVSSTIESSPGGVINYKLPQRISLRSDGSSEKVKVRSSPLSGNLLYVAVPSMSPHVFREATLKNTSDAPLLPGTLSVFSNGSFVGRQSIAFVAREMELKLPVGISEDILVKRKLIRRFEEDPGIVRSLRRISTEYAIEVENLSEQPRKLVLLEPEVTSRNEKIKVRIDKQEPAAIAADKAERLFKEPGLIEWQLPLKAREKLSVTNATSVEFPADVKVSGIENL